MLTVVLKKGEYEEVIPSVCRVWLRGKGTYEEPQKQTLGVETADKNGDLNNVTIYEEGSFYVMNENGKTVATYHLGPSGMNPVG